MDSDGPAFRECAEGRFFNVRFCATSPFTVEVNHLTFANIDAHMKHGRARQTIKVAFDDGAWSNVCGIVTVILHVVLVPNQVVDL